MKRLMQVLLSGLLILMPIALFSFTVSAYYGQDNALYFDDDSSITSLLPYNPGTSPYTGPFTVEFKIYLDYDSEESISWMGIYWANDHGTPQYNANIDESGFYIDSDNTVSYWIGSNHYESNASLDFRKWTHVAFVYDGAGNLKIYLDGELDSEFSGTATLMLPPWHVTMGGRYSLYNSALDDLRIWNVARTGAEISACYEARLYIHDYFGKLYRYYRFDEGSGGGDNTSITQLYDSASGSWTGDLSNFDLTGDTSNFIEVASLEDSGSATETDAGSNPSETSVSCVPRKLHPHTLLLGQSGGIQTTDLSYLVAIPEQWMVSTAKVELWLNAAVVTAKQDGYAYLDPAAANLKIAGVRLLESYDVRLMKRVTGADGTVSEGDVDPEYIRGNLTVRISIPSHLRTIPNLGLCWVDETGAIAYLDHARVLIDGTSYIEFVNNNFATAYAFVAD